MAAIELRPGWCFGGSLLDELVLGPWADDEGRSTKERDGDDWKPGDSVLLTRSVELVDALQLRRELGLSAEVGLGLAARWYCRATGVAGVHLGGPHALDLLYDTLRVEIPGQSAATVQLETCLVATSVGPYESVGDPPTGGVVWSDSWSAESEPEPLTLEGSELRIPVRTLSFAARFPETKSSLWAIELESSVEPDDLVVNVCTILLNRDVLDRDFEGSDGVGDASLLPDAIMTAITVDLVRSITAAVRDELDDFGLDLSAPEGSVQHLLGVWLEECFGGPASARRELEDDTEMFSRRLWSRFAPDSWIGRR